MDRSQRDFFKRSSGTVTGAALDGVAGPEASPASMTQQCRQSGLAVLGDMPWGSHCCHFYKTQQDLLETLVPYFKVGLQSREFCLWIVHEPMTEEKARRSLRAAVPGADQYLADRSLEIVPARTWYLKRGAFSLKRVMRQWDAKLEEASARGYAGMRANGLAGWLAQERWRRFSEYEETLNESLTGKSMLVLCSYPVAVCGADEVLDVVRTHHFAVAKRHGAWEVVEWRTPPTGPGPYEALTAREREVLLLAAQGLTSKEIGERLGVSARTAESHRASLLRKLKLSNQTALVRYAVERRLLPL